MYAWEKSFSDFVKDVRSAELSCIKKQAYINTLSGLAYYNSKYLVSRSISIVYLFFLLLI